MVDDGPWPLGSTLLGIRVPGVSAVSRYRELKSEVRLESGTVPQP